MKDFIKIFIDFIAYFGIGPLLGLMIAQSRQAQRIVFCLMVFMPCLPPGKITLNVDSWELYRGHTKGFEANWIEVLGIAIIIASYKNRLRALPWKLFGPGVGIYCLYAVACMLSIFSAHDRGFACMAALKFTKAVIMFMAGFHFLRDETDISWVLRTMAGGQIFYVLLGLKMRYVDHVYQVQGWFEHQNPMSIWCYMNGIPLLAAALYKKTCTRDFMLYISGVVAAAVCILLSVSRGGLGAFTAGCAGVLAVMCLRSPASRVFLVTVGCVVAALLASAFAMNSLHARINEVAETSDNNEYDLRDILVQQSNAMLHNSFVGIGWNNFGVMNSRPEGDKYSKILEDWDESRGFHIIDDNYNANPLTESLYWLILAENGYPGFVTYFMFLAATLWFAAHSAWRFRDNLWGVFAGAQVAAFGLCYAHGKVERILTQTKNLSFWLLMAGLVAAIYSMPKKIKKHSCLADKL